MVIFKIKIVRMSAVALWFLIGIAGCVGTSKNNVAGQGIEKNAFQISQRPVFSTPTPAEGSLWTDNGAFSFYMDLRARRVGDTVTVDIVENTSSSIDANTKVSRTSDIDAGVSQALGYMRALESMNKNLNKDSGGELNSTQFKASFENSFDGKGTSDRSGQVTASVGAIVTEVLPNGNLVIFGKRGMRVNNETQFITVSGIVRPEDIDRSNRIQSTFIAESRIEYIGQGVVADKQRPGWGTRLLDHIWPF